MRPLLCAFVLLTARVSLAGEAPVNRPQVIPAPVQHVFVPSGFDDNDSVEVLVYGEFDDSCLRVDQAVARVDAARRRIDVTVTALRYANGNCIPLRTPFLMSVRVGLLAQGNYEVQVNGASGPSERLTVNHTDSAAADDFLYAPVSHASLSRDEAGRQVLHIEGRYPPIFMACAVMSEVRTYVAPSNVLVVLPIMEVRPLERCEGVSVSFRIDQPVLQELVGPGLLHVRVLNGASYNRYVESGITP